LHIVVFGILLNSYKHNYVLLWSSASVDSFPILTLNDLDPEFVLSLLVDALDDFMWQFLLLHQKPADLPAANFLQDH
jgi:hypothetical protein